MKLQIDDTDPEAERVLIELLRRAPIWKRVEQTVGLINLNRALALADLRSRYPHAGEEELRRRLAARMLSREDVIRTFGWDPQLEGY